MDIATNWSKFGPRCMCSRGRGAAGAMRPRLFHGPTFVVLPVPLLVERRGGGLVQVVEQRDALVRVYGDEHVRAHRVDVVALEPPAHTHIERDK